MVVFSIMKKYNCRNIETELQALGPLCVVHQRRSTLIPLPQNLILQHLQNFHCHTTNGICCQKHPLELDHTSSLSVSKEKNFFSTFFFLHAEYIVAHPPLTVLIRGAELPILHSFLHRRETAKERKLRQTPKTCFSSVSVVFPIS